MSEFLEPWETDKPDDAGGWNVLFDSKGNEIGSGDGGYNEPCARRIVACVNACAGIATEHLEEVQGEFGKAFLDTRERAVNYKQQRDGLLAALKELLVQIPEVPERNCSCHISPPCNDCVDNSGLRTAIEESRAAITKAEA